MLAEGVFISELNFLRIGKGHGKAQEKRPGQNPQENLQGNPTGKGEDGWPTKGKELAIKTNNSTIKKTNQEKSSS